jgi:hypothetical protein
MAESATKEVALDSVWKVSTVKIGKIRFLHAYRSSIIGFCDRFNLVAACGYLIPVSEDLSLRNGGIR